jgi:hypothetical protein
MLLIMDGNCTSVIDDGLAPGAQTVNASSILNFNRWVTIKKPTR